jgi:hypothetical protein
MPGPIQHAVWGRALTYNRGFNVVAFNKSKFLSSVIRRRLKKEKRVTLLFPIADVIIITDVRIGLQSACNIIDK